MTRNVLPIERGPLTDYLLEQISSVITVGDAQAPEEGGWNGPPDAADSEYTPYVVLVPGTAGDSTGPIADSLADIQLNYIVTGYGLSRSHVEHYMDLVRKVLVATSRTMVVLGDSSWKIQQVRADSIGGISRNDSIEPSEFSQTDVVVLYMSKEL
jgi:hypothetical protein